MATAAIPPSTIHPASTPVNGNRLTFSPSTFVPGVPVVPGLRVCFSPRTQVPSGPACAGAVHGVVGVQSLFAAVGTQSGSGTQVPLLKCSPSGQVSVGGVQTPLTTVLGGSHRGGAGGVQPVCAGLVLAMPLLPSHS